MARLFLILFTFFIPIFSNQGIQLFQAGKLEEARRFFNKRLKQNRTDRIACFYLGKLEKDGEKSRRYFSRVLEGGKKDQYTQKALFSLGQYYYSKGNYKNSADMLGRLLNNYPHNPFKADATLWLGLSFLAQGRHAEAERFCKKIEEDNPPVYIRAQVVLGLIAASLKEYTRSSQYLKGALSFGDNTMRPTTYYQLYLNYKETGDKKSANTYLRKLILEFPSSLETAKIKKDNGGHLPSLDKEGEKKVSGLSSYGFYTLQLGAFSLKENAQRFKERLQVSYEDVEIREKKKGSAVLYLVWLGHFQNKEKAVNFATKNLNLSQENYQVLKREH
jgi:TolA-binding protein